MAVIADTIYYGNKDYVASTTAKDVPAFYAESCGECHLSYQPYLLPASSWEELMKPIELENHFEEFLEFEPNVYQQIYAYLSNDTENTRKHRRYYKFAKSVNSNAPLRITETRYFLREHDEINEQRMVINNSDVLSFSNCTACHQKAIYGDYDEDFVVIPNFEDWDD